MEHFGNVIKQICYSVDVYTGYLLILYMVIYMFVWDKITLCNIINKLSVLEMYIQGSYYYCIWENINMVQNYTW
jgi:hypothetical protein